MERVYYTTRKWWQYYCRVLHYTETVLITCYSRWGTTILQLIEMYVKMPHVNIIQQYTSCAFTEGFKTFKLNSHCSFCHCLIFTISINVLFLIEKNINFT